MAKKILEGLKLTKCWQTSDGETFVNEAEAKRHQIRSNFCGRLATHLEILDIGSDDCNITTDVIMEDLDQLANIFEIYLEERKL